MIIKVTHLRQIKFCCGGARKFFKRHNLDWQDFIKNGIPSEKLLATKDGMAEQLVEHAKNGQEE